MADPITTSRETNSDSGGHVKEKMQADNSSIEGTVLHQDQEQGAVDGFSPEEERRLIRKVDWALLPLLSFLYLVSFIDRSNSKSTKSFSRPRWCFSLWCQRFVNGQELLTS